MYLSQLFEARVAQDAAQAGMHAAARHPSAFIHFTDIPKLGINPSKRHKDAPGIYFYPCRWLLNPENLSGFQYGLSMQHYFVAQPKPGARIVNLATLTLPQARKLASYGGWGPMFEQFVADPKSMARSGAVTKDKAVQRKAGFLWYGGMDHLAESGAFSWVTMLRGVDAIYDPGLGIVHPDEPAQLIAMRRDVISVIEHGDNRDMGQKVQGRAMAEAAKRLGGTFGWRDKVPFLRAEIDGKPVEVEDRWGEDWTYSFLNGVWTAETHRSYSETDEAGLIDSYMGLARMAARQAEPEGRVSRWTPAAVDKMTRLIPMRMRLRPLKTMHYGKPLAPAGVLRYGAGNGSVHFASLDVQPDDSVRFKFMIGGREGSPLADFAYEREFPADIPEREIAATIGRELPDAMMERLKHLPPVLDDGRHRRDLVLKSFGLTTAE